MAETDVPGGGREGEREANTTLRWFLLLAILSGALVVAIGFLIAR